jgi:hypothetical protein
MRPAWTEPNLLAVSMKFEDGNPRLAEVRSPLNYFGLKD